MRFALSHFILYLSRQFYSRRNEKYKNILTSFYRFLSAWIVVSASWLRRRGELERKSKQRAAMRDLR